MEDTTGHGLGGAVVTLTGTTRNGQTVTMAVTTAADGSYSFTELQPGTYMLTETTPPAGYQDDFATVGTVNGTNDGSAVQPVQFTGITLGASGVGINYDFVDTLAGS
jgi:uncharacterized surface anchored protein